MKFFLTCLCLAVAASSVSSQVCLSESNTARKNNGNLAAFSNNAQLVAAAQAHNDLMVNTGCFSHQCTGEVALGQRVTNAGYKWSAAAENLAAGSATCSGSVTQWLGSAGHRANLLGNFKHFGCATKYSATSTYKHYWTCVYANPL